MTTATRPTPTTNLNEAARASNAKINVQLPATVVSYDKDTQTVTVKIVPCFRRRDPSQGNDVVCYSPPVVSGVPVSFLRGGTSSLTFPLVAGDPGLLMVCDRSIDEWKSTGNDRTEPQDQRRHDISDAYFYPGGSSPAVPIPAAGVDATAAVLRGDEVKLGDATASSAVALGPPVTTNLTTLEAALATASSAAIAAAVPADGGIAAFTAFASSLVSTLAAWPIALSNACSSPNRSLS